MFMGKKMYNIGESGRVEIEEEEEEEKKRRRRRRRHIRSINYLIEVTV